MSTPSESDSTHPQPAIVVPDSYSHACYGGIGIPLLDLIAPADHELVEGGRIVAQLAARLQEATRPGGRALTEAQNKIYCGNVAARRELDQTAQHGSAHVSAALDALKALTGWIETKNLKGGDKRQLTDEESARVAGEFEAILVAARDINKAAEFLDQKQQELWVRHGGGTMYNKLHALHAGLGTPVEMFAVMAQPDPQNPHGHSNRLHKLVADSGISLTFPNGVSLSKTPHGYAIMRDGDRISLKSEVERFADRVASHTNGELDAFLGKLGVILIEASDASSSKFGREFYQAYLKKALATNKPIVFSPPTDAKRVLGDPKDPKKQAEATAFRQQCLEVMRAPQVDLITMNESEAVATFLGEKLEPAKPLLDDHGREYDGGFRTNPQIVRAIRAAEDLLFEKCKELPPGSLEPMVLLTVGKEGGLAITSHTIVFQAAQPSAKLVNTLGAGDAFAGAAIARRAQIVDAMRHNARAPEIGKRQYNDGRSVPYDPSQLLRYTQQELRDILKTGQEVARATVETKGAQLPPAKIAEIIHDSPPTKGALEKSPVPTPAPEHARA